MKKTLIITAIICIIIVGVLLYIHYTPFWVNLTTVASFGIGTVVGWIVHVIYSKYFKGGIQNESID